jgi:hypothetical protein
MLKTKFYFSAFFFLLAAIPFLTSMGSIGCDSTTTPAPTPAVTPTVTSVLDTEGNILDAADSTVSVNVGLIVVFSTAMTVSTVTSTTVPLVCDGTTVATTITPITITDVAANSVFKIFPDADLSQVVSCTFTITTGVQSSGGAALASASDYIFTSGCASSDDFTNSATLAACYSFNNTSNQTNVVNTFPDDGTITIESGQLQFAMGPTTSVLNPGVSGFNFLPSAAKAISAGEDFTVQLTIASGTLMVDGDLVGLMIVPSMSEEFDDVFICAFQIANGGADTECLGAAVEGTIFTLGVEDTGPDCDLGVGTPPGDFAPNLVFQISRVGSTFTCSEKLVTDSNFTIVNDSGVPATVDISSLAGDVFIGIIGASANGASTYLVDDLLFTVGGAVGQD